MLSAISVITYDPILQSLDLHPDHAVDVLRLDLLHPEISGNKWFKLKYNLQEALAGNFKTVITFGGAASNHIAATAAACKAYGLQAIGIIRGEQEHKNDTLGKAKEQGMQLHFISREKYAEKNSAAFQEELKKLFGGHYLIPEGGNNAAGALGCKEILRAEWGHDLVLCACGTATTFAGLAASASPTQRVIGISVLKGENKLPLEAMALLNSISSPQTVIGNDVLDHSGHHGISAEYSFSGYAKFDKQLLDFKSDFENRFSIPLDHIYTSKLFYAVNDLLQRGKIEAGKKILVVHSGGLQGNASFEARYLGRS